MKAGIFMCEECLNNYKKVVDIVEKDIELQRFKQRLLCVHYRNKYICKKKPEVKKIAVEEPKILNNNKVSFFQPRV